MRLQVSAENRNKVQGAEIAVSSINLHELIFGERFNFKSVSDEIPTSAGVVWVSNVFFSSSEVPLLTSVTKIGEVIENKA